MTSPNFRDTASGYCYRHPNRQSFVLCQRCGRTICGECQTPGAVGVICPECMWQQRATAPSGPSVATRAGRRFAAFNRSSAPVMTYALIAICVVVYVFEMFTTRSGAVENALAFRGVQDIPGGIGGVVPYQPWRLVTAIFVHASIIHILLNMYTLWIFGQALEPLIGKWRYLSLFLITGVAGNVLVMILIPTTWVVGASGALFGMMGCFAVIQRHLGGRITQLVVLIAINFVISFIPEFGGLIAWQAHLGGLLIGVLIGFIYTRTRQRQQQRLQYWLIGSIAAVVLVIGLLGPTVWHPLSAIIS